jgi:hypothetical protein
MPDEAEESFETATTAERPSPSEFWLVKLLFLHENLVGWAALHLQPEWLQHGIVREIVRRRFAAQAEETWNTLAAFLDTCESPAMQSLLTEAVAEARPIPNPEQQLADVVLRLRNQEFDRQIALLTHRASQPETSEVERIELLRQQQEMRQFKKRTLSGA